MKGAPNPAAAVVEALAAKYDYRPGDTFGGGNAPEIATAEQALGWVCAVSRAKARLVREQERLKEQIAALGGPSPKREAERQRLTGKAKDAREARFHIDEDLDRVVDLLGELLLANGRPKAEPAAKPSKAKTTAAKADKPEPKRGKG